MTAYFPAISATLLLCMFPAEAGAQEPATCTLHIWPSNGLSSIYSGWTHGGIVNGAVTGRDGYPPVSAEPIDTARQVALLADSKIQDLLGRPGDRVIVHDEALPSRVVRTTATRIAAAASDCYAELIVDDAVFQQDVFSGSYLKMSLRFRDFGTDAMPRRVFGTWVKTRLTLSPPPTPAGIPAAGAELQEAYRHNLALFAQALLKPATPRR